MRYVQCVLIAFFLLVNGFLTSASSSERDTVTVALIDTFGPDFYVDTFVPTIEYLKKKLPRFNFKIVELDRSRLQSEIDRTKPDFLVSSAGDYVSLIDSKGTQQIVTKMRKDAKEVFASVGSAFFVKSERKDIQSLEDLKGKRIAGTSPIDFDGWLIGMDELTKHDLEPEKIFNKTIFTEYNYPDPVTYVKVGHADVAVLPVCEFEKLVNEGQINAKDFRVLNPKNQEGEACRRSTELFPDVVFSSMPSAPPLVVKSVTLALLSMPAGENFEWIPSNSFLDVYELLKDLKIGPYEHLREKTLKSFILEHEKDIYLAVLFIFAVLIHIVRVNWMVKKRTDELHAAVAEQRKIEREEEENRRKLDLMEKNLALVQMCSLFAHEVKQPITNILYYASGLKLLLAQLQKTSPEVGEVIGKIQDQAKRTAEIVDHVRSYAKQDARKIQKVDLQEIVTQALKNIVPANRNLVKVRVLPGETFCIEADPFEIELVVLNLTKNAISAVKGEQDAQIEISLSKDQGKVIFSISDNGPPIDTQLLNSLGKPVKSQKKEGLGVGLSIAISIVERHGGHMTFTPRPEGGLIVQFILKETHE